MTATWPAAMGKPEILVVDLLLFPVADLGFQQISVEPVVAAPEESYALRGEDLPQLFEEYDKLAVELVKRQKEHRGFNFRCNKI